jgi:hypothetical protein
LEAASGFEPLHKGFADLSLATWVRRPKKVKSEKLKVKDKTDLKTS